MPFVALNAAEAPLTLALDLGTSSFRALLFDRLGRAVYGSEEQVRYKLITTPDGGAEADAHMLFGLLLDTFDHVLKRAGERGNEIAAVGISCFWHSLLGLDEAGEPVTPVLFWADTRSARQVAALRTVLDQAEAHQRTGTVIHSSYWPAKLRWLKETRPAVFERVVRWCSFADFATRQIHGQDFTSLSMASGTGMLDVRSGDWDEEIIAAAGIERSTLPEIVPASTPITTMRAAFSERWPYLVEIPWFPGIGDGACANVGCGAITSDRIALTVGTSAAIRVIIDRPIGQAFEIPSDVWAYRLDEQRVVFGGALSNGGNVVSWLRGVAGEDPTEETMSEAGAIAPDSHGLTVLPFLAGERSPIWNDRATGVIAGLTLSTGKVELLRAFMEAVALRLSLIYTSIVPLVEPDHKIVLNGGAVLHSPVWMKIIADALGHPVTPLPPEEESSARGGALIAMVSAGIISDLGATLDPADGCQPIEPISANAPLYEAARDRQLRLESLLLPDDSVWSDLQEPTRN
jgi:gluconokinase